MMRSRKRCRKADRPLDTDKGDRCFTRSPKPTYTIALQQIVRLLKVDQSQMD